MFSDVFSIFSCVWASRFTSVQTFLNWLYVYKCSSSISIFSLFSLYIQFLVQNVIIYKITERKIPRQPENHSDYLAGCPDGVYICYIHSHDITKFSNYIDCVYFQSAAAHKIIDCVCFQSAAAHKKKEKYNEKTVSWTGPTTSSASDRGDIVFL